jgi:hypothetical protein
LKPHYPGLLDFDNAPGLSDPISEHTKWMKGTFRLCAHHVLWRPLMPVAGAQYRH